jgi:hypothetical protein
MKVTLPGTHRPVFPDRCVSCGEPDPGDRVIVDRLVLGWWLLAHAAPGRRFTVTVPVCPACQESPERRNNVVLGFRRTIYFLLLMAWMFALLFMDKESVAQWVVLFAIGAILGISAFKRRSSLKPAFGMTPYSETVVYRFRDEGYAAEFLSINPHYGEPTA